MTAPAAAEASGTPKHLWIIGAVALLWNGMGAFDYFMTQTRNTAYMGSFTAEQLEFFYGLPAWTVALWAIAVWGGVLASVLLLLRKQAAVVTFLVSLACAVLVAFQNFVLSDGLEVMGTGGVGFSALILVVAFLLWRYTRTMRTRGVLS